MCQSSRVSRTHIIRAQYPYMTNAFCHSTISIIQSISPRTAICDICFFRTYRYDNYKLTLFHWFVEGTPLQEYCITCGKSLTILESITSCSQCYSKYVNVINIIRSKGIGPINISTLIYDHVNRKIFKLEICYNINVDFMNRALLNN